MGERKGSTVGGGRSGRWMVTIHEGQRRTLNSGEGGGEENVTQIEEESKE